MAVDDPWITSPNATVKSTKRAAADGEVEAEQLRGPTGILRHMFRKSLPTAGPVFRVLGRAVARLNTPLAGAIGRRSGQIFLKKVIVWIIILEKIRRYGQVKVPIRD